MVVIVVDGRAVLVKRISEDGHIFAEGGERSVAPCAGSNVVNIIKADSYDESKEAPVGLVEAACGWALGAG